VPHRAHLVDPVLRPRVLINVASTLDGKINPARGKRTGAFQMSRGPTDIQRMRRLRARVDAVLIGAGNLRADDPDLGPEEDAEGRRGSTQGMPMRVVVTTRGEGIDPQMRVFDPTLGGRTVVAHCACMPTSTRSVLATHATLVEFGDASVDMARLLAWLWAEGVRAVVCEGGGAINAELFAASAVDELYLTLVPRLLGGATAPTPVDGPGFSPDTIPDARLNALERDGDELFLRYEFRWTR
jgi:2,5-diamino-6-(ribosylamino)-4(3H)-pyrimidinone 5'-phosphate reductase